jgi:hypothetical protein
VSYYEPASLNVYFFDGASGKEIEEARYEGQRGEQGGLIATSRTGDYTALITAQGTAVTLAVLHKSGKHHSQHLHSFNLQNVESQALAISGDGQYVACGQAYSFTVYQKSAANFSCVGVLS